MMKIRLSLCVLFAALAFIAPPHLDGILRAAALAPVPQQDEVAITLRNPGTHPRLGLPDFVAPGASPDLAKMLTTIADVLWDDIDFEREYFMIPRKTSASVPVAPYDRLPYDEWTNLGADFVLAGNASASGSNAVTIELRLIRVKADKRGQSYFAMRYECGLQTARGPRDCAHAIADDFHKQARQLDGVARTKLAFSSNRDALRVTGRPSQTVGQSKEIYISDYDGFNQMRFTVNRSLNINPSWSPSGSLLAYTSYMSGFPDIYVANLAQPGQGLSRPAHGNEEVHNQLPAWSPDGSKLAFMSNRKGNSDIYIVNRDGTGLLNLTNSPWDEVSPTWSPDGNKIAFISTRSGVNQLYVMSATGTGVMRLSDQQADRPTWSPLNFIAFTVGSGPGHDIGIYDFSNPGVRVITNGLGSNESPAIAPNGRHIVFVTTRWGRKQLAVIDRTGENIRRLTEVGDNEHPTWQPLPRP
jgi:TolB protein